MLRRTIAAAGLALIPALALADSPQVSLGSFRPGERVSAPEDHAPARTSRAFVTTVAAEGEARIAVPATGGGRLLLLVHTASASKSAGVAVSLTTPSGDTLTAGESATADQAIRRFALESAEPGDLGLDLAGVKEALEVKAAEAGVYTVEVKAEGQAAVTVVAAEPESALTLKAWAGPLSRQPQEPVALHAELHDGKAGLAGARVIAQLAAPGEKTGRALRLFDDGRHDDGAPNDGVYAGFLADLDGPAGPWSVR
ncbi:MAG TPA: choice-of-anchor X domain-containing protein, partial [Vicinamibacteria bacterium]|nr:choice-of-anchor X domain-containing protein [Vicinamibacteria bacterium]